MRIGGRPRAPERGMARMAGCQWSVILFSYFFRELISRRSFSLISGSLWYRGLRSF
jgi:hypothetical protein